MAPPTGMQSYPCSRNFPAASRSADGRNPELIADFSSEAIVNFSMARHGNFCASRRIREDRMPATFSGEIASLLAEVVQQFAPFHLRAAPA